MIVSEDKDKNFINVEEVIAYMEEKNISGMTYHNLSAKLKRDFKKNFTHNGNLVCRDNNICNLYLDFNYVKESVELYLNSIDITNLAKKLIEINKTDVNSNNMKRISSVICTRFNFYKIELFDCSKNYISISDYNEILNKSEDFRRKECITQSELIDKMNSLYCGVEYSTHHLFSDMVKEYNLEVFYSNYKYNFISSRQVIYPKKTVEKLVELFTEYLRTHVYLMNITFEEYLSLTENEFNEIYKELKEEDIESIGETYKSLLISARKFRRAFEDTNIKVIHFWTYRRKIYVSKKEFAEFVNFKQNYIKVSDYMSENGYPRFVVGTAKTNGIDYKIYKGHFYVTKSNLDKYIKVDNFNKKYFNAESLYDRVNLKIMNFPHKKDNDFPEVRELILDFTKDCNISSKNTLGRYPSAIYNTYNLILDYIQCNLIKENETLNNELFEKIIIKVTNSNIKLRLIAFVNYLKEKKKFKLKGFFDIKNSEEILPYSAEGFINLLSHLLEVIYDENEFRKLYRNWNLSSSFLYVLLHFSLAWRRVDLLTKIPIINSKLANSDIEDGESFIKWLEDGNTLSHESCMDICKSVEEQTNRLREKASKNNIQLSCIICDSLTEPIGTLLYINEANRQIHINKYKNHQKNERCFNSNYTIPKKIQHQFKKYFDIDINKILGGDFSNIRMTKGFLTLVTNKAEELDLFGYYYSQLLRGHHFDKNKLSETTKIYLNKSTDANSVMAFATGTMGSVTYMLLQLLDENFNNKSKEEKILAINETNLTPYAIEKNMKIISNNVSKLNSELEKYFTNNGDKEVFLKDLLYGQQFYGIEERTKCLLKITRKEDCITRIAPLNEEDDKLVKNKCPLSRRSCIGCDYVISLRYFIYVFESKFKQILTKLENAKSEIDKEIIVEIINSSYIPLLNDLAILLGKEEVFKVVDMNRYIQLVESY